MNIVIDIFEVLAAIVPGIISFITLREYREEYRDQVGRMSRRWGDEQRD